MGVFPKAAPYLLCSNILNSFISPCCFGDTPVTIEFPTDPGFSTSMSLRYLQAVLGFFQNARCITVGRSSPASARVSGPSDLNECMVNAVRSPALRACTFSTFVISSADMGVFPLMGVFGRRELLRKRYPLFGSLSRTVTCTAELSALIRVIPRGKDLIPSCLDHSI